ncbi:hypothetical protein HYQ46_003528 [Verticillium longisporum]|nr:hypothetical protein HYQ46_003528 [Verticillium longisporum]
MIEDQNIHEHTVIVNMPSIVLGKREATPRQDTGYARRLQSIRYHELRGRAGGLLHTGKKDADIVRR